MIGHQWQSKTKISLIILSKTAHFRERYGLCPFSSLLSTTKQDAFSPFHSTSQLSLYNHPTVIKLREPFKKPPRNLWVSFGKRFLFLRQKKKIMANFQNIFSRSIPILPLIYVPEFSEPSPYSRKISRRDVAFNHNISWTIHTNKNTKSKIPKLNQSSFNTCLTPGCSGKLLQLCRNLIHSQLIFNPHFHILFSPQLSIFS